MISKIATVVVTLIMVFCISDSENVAFAEDVCGPGMRLADNAWACVRDNRVRRPAEPPARNNQVAAGVALGGALFSIVESLASQAKMTDDVSSINPIVKQHANRSVEYNRQGLALQRAGKFNEARIAFRKAAEEAINGGSSRDSIINNRNADIADALYWLRQGYDAEKAGKTTKANIAYQTGLQIARQAGIDSISSKLEKANDQLINRNGHKGMIKSNQYCQNVNGKLACAE